MIGPAATAGQGPALKSPRQPEYWRCVARQPLVRLGFAWNCRALPLLPGPAAAVCVDRKGPGPPGRADTCEVLCTNNCFNFKPSLLRRRQKHKTGKCQAIHEMLQQQQQPSWKRLTKLFYDQDTCRWPGHIYEIFYRPVHWVQSLSAASNVPQTTFDQPSWWVWPFCVVQVCLD